MTYPKTVFIFKINLQMTPIVLPWKLPLKPNIKASFSGIFLRIYAHLLASLSDVSTASAPVFIGKTISYLKISVIYLANSPKVEL